MTGLTGGTFKAMINNGSADKLLLSNQLLLNRIEKIKKEKEDKVNQKIKLNYNKLNEYKRELELDNSNVKLINTKIKLVKQTIETLNNTLTIPTIADVNVTHDFFIVNSFKPFVSIGSEYSKSIVSIKPQLGGSCHFSIPNHGDFFSDMCLYIKFSKFHAKNPLNKVRYCDFVGHRLLKNTRMVLDSKLIDQYTSEDYNFHYQYGVPQDKQLAWKKCIGQETEIDAYLTSDPDNHEFREIKRIKNGPQTYKHEQPELEMFIPLLFWFTDPKYAMLSSKIPKLQSFIEFEFEEKHNLTDCNNESLSTGELYKHPDIEECVLYVKHLFVCEEVLNIFIERTGVTLIRLHRTNQTIVNKSYVDVQLDKFKFPTETFYISFRPLENINGENKMDTWYINNKIEQKSITYPVIFGNADTLGQANAYYYKKTGIVDSLSIGGNEICVFDTMPSQFYNAYLPYKHSSSNYMCEDDTGSFLMNFYLDKGLTYQPNGYVNLSKTSDFALSYSSSKISADFPCLLTVSSISINFLLLQKDKLELYYRL